MTHFISTRQLVGQSYTVLVNGEKVGIVSRHSEGVWKAVAGHVKLGEFGTKVQAVNAVAEASGFLPQ